MKISALATALLVAAKTAPTTASCPGEQKRLIVVVDSSAVTDPDFLRVEILEDCSGLGEPVLFASGANDWLAVPGMEIIQNGVAGQVLLDLCVQDSIYTVFFEMVAWSYESHSLGAISVQYDGSLSEGDVNVYEPSRDFVLGSDCSTGSPTLSPTVAPTGSPSFSPTGAPTISPTAMPTPTRHDAGPFQNYIGWGCHTINYRSSGQSCNNVDWHNGYTSSTACVHCGGGDHNPPALPRQCNDTPNWSDVSGLTCDSFPSLWRCARSGDWHVDANGLSPRWACCSCGGGNEFDEAPRTVSFKTDASTYIHALPCSTSESDPKSCNVGTHPSANDNWTKFKLHNAGSGYYYIESVAHGTYLYAEVYRSAPHIPQSTDVGQLSNLQNIPRGDGLTKWYMTEHDTAAGKRVSFRPYRVCWSSDTDSCRENRMFLSGPKLHGNTYFELVDDVAGSELFEIVDV